MSYGPDDDWDRNFTYEVGDVVYQFFHPDGVARVVTMVNKSDPDFCLCTISGRDEEFSPFWLRPAPFLEVLEL